jgi:hypothetical protein
VHTKEADTELRDETILKPMLALHAELRPRTLRAFNS